MEKEPSIFDEQIQSRNLQMLKIAIPYIDAPMKKTLAVFIKYIELQKTMSLFDQGNLEALSISSQATPQEKCIQMLSEMKGIMSDKERDSIDNFLNMFQLISSYDNIFSQEPL